MCEWSWKQAVAERILGIVGSKGSSDFTIEEVYAYTGEFSKLFPRNQHVQEKVRQTLQKLRDDSLLLFQGGGNYSLNLEYEELESEPEPLTAREVQVPKTKQVIRNIRLRSTLLGAEIKRRYNHTCQVCRNPVPIRLGKNYAEAHHLWPIGSPHYGPDVSGNIVVLCPNCHAMFDRGAVTILPDTLCIRHIVEAVFSKRTRLYLERQKNQCTR